MEMIIKCAGLAICSCALTLLLKPINPEMSLLLSVSVIAAVFYLSTDALHVFVHIIDKIRNYTSDTEIYISPLLKCVGIAVVVKISGDICRDASQNAAATALEYAGAVCALGAAMPLIDTLITTVYSLI